MANYIVVLTKSNPFPLTWYSKNAQKAYNKFLILKRGGRTVKAENGDATKNDLIKNCI